MRAGQAEPVEGGGQGGEVEFEVVGAGLGLDGELLDALTLRVIDLELERLGLGAGEGQGCGAGGGVGGDGVPNEGVGGFGGGDGALISGEVYMHVGVSVTTCPWATSAFNPKNANRIGYFTEGKIESVAFLVGRPTECSAGDTGEPRSNSTIRISIRIHSMVNGGIGIKRGEGYRPDIISGHFTLPKMTSNGGNK